ncbi:MAG: hypothetical protein WC533_01455 [Candidatus Pacearchaeota archaeon]
MPAKTKVADKEMKEEENKEFEEGDLEETIDEISEENELESFSEFMVSSKHVSPVLHSDETIGNLEEDLGSSEGSKKSEEEPERSINYIPTAGEEQEANYKVVSERMGIVKGFGVHKKGIGFHNPELDLGEAGRKYTSPNEDYSEVRDAESGEDRFKRRTPWHRDEEEA